VKKLTGVFTALVTPFKNDAVDYASLENLVVRQLADKVNGFVVNGTTAESPTLTAAERKQIFTVIKKLVPSDFPLVMGTGSNSTAKSIEETKEAEQMGADAALVVVPYYNKPPQAGLLEHFSKIASATKLPNLLYNVPGRTITSLELTTIVKLAAHPNIVGIKEASGDIEFAKKIRQSCGAEFILLSGDDGTYDEFMSVGGNGVISVASHIIANAFHKRSVTKYKALVDLLFKEPNPIPVKMALYQMGILSTAECRLPLVKMSEPNANTLNKILSENGLLQ
jgi:4-hydroxy-tetrahydrodipicolinate synthase